MDVTPPLKIYDHLLRFPLFQGLSRAELLQLAGNTKFGFVKEKEGRIVTQEETPCQQLMLLVKGKLLLRQRSDDGGYTILEQIASSWVVQPEALFGAHPYYTVSCTTIEPCHFIVLSKDEVLRLLDDFLIFRLNMLNLLSTQAQRRNRMQWRREPLSLRERFVRFVIDHVTYPAGPKELLILMKRLAAELGDSRLDVSRMLNQLQAEQLLQLHRGRIVIPSLEHLLT